MVSDQIALTERERATLERILAPFAEHIQRVAIFGSRVLGRARAASDIDIVLYGTTDDRMVARIWTMFDEGNLPVTVDVVRYEGLAETSFRRHIDRYARPLFTRDDLLRARLVRSL